MEIVITNIDFEHIEVVHMGEKYGFIDNIELSTANVAFDIFKNGNKLNGIHEVPFEQYRKMNHDELTEYLGKLFL